MDLKEALEFAGNNKEELIKILKYFENDSLKYKAACFLIENIKWHSSEEKITYINPKVPEIFYKIDSIFYGVSHGLTINELTIPEVRKVFTFKERITKNFLKTEIGSITKIEEFIRTTL